jgi:hypothetical protein
MVKYVLFGIGKILVWYLFFGNHEEHQELGRLQLEEIDLLDVQVGIHHLV